MRALIRYLGNPLWHRQHRWRRAIWRTMSRMGLNGLHVLPINRQWVEVHRRPMPLLGLDESLAGLRIVQISDLHYSPLVGRRYLLQLVGWVNDLAPDIVAVTGDLITGGYRFVDGVADILSRIRAARGVVCVLGNHDYGLYGAARSAEGLRRAARLVVELRNAGVVVLRNQRWTMPGARRSLTIVGLDDERSGNLDAEAAFDGVDAGSPVLCLNHNPANCLRLMRYPWQWMLSGHTHGRQVATTALGRRLYGHRWRHFTHGHYLLNGRHLYVNRGLAYGRRALEWCRPEITLFRTVAA